MARKIPPYAITRVTNGDPSFYSLVGPFLARREIVAELGSPTWDDDDKIWLVAHTETETLGFIAIQPEKSAWSIRSLYVRPEARNEVIGSTLVLRALELNPATTYKATATEASRDLFIACGFIERDKRGKRFTLLELAR
jgi:N-acetylglutamate synthase-like GNAT family acetyltransferase